MMVLGNIGPQYNANLYPLTPGASPGAGSSQASTGANTASSGAAQAESPETSLLLSQGEVLLAPLFNMENSIPPHQVGLLLRNLLQMPKEVVQLLALLANMPEVSPQELLKKLIAEDIQIPLSELQSLLQDHLKNGEGKLLKLLQSSQTAMSGGSKSMGDLLSTLSQLSKQANQSPSQALQNTLAMYLPFNPMGGPQKFFLYFEELEGGSGEAGEASGHQLVLFIETLTLGLFKIVIGLESGTQLQIQIEHDPSARSILEPLQAEVSAALSPGSNLPPPQINFQERATSDPKHASVSEQAPPLIESPAEKARQSVGIHPMGGVSAVAIHAAYVLARVIIELDNRNALIQHRAQQI